MIIRFMASQKRAALPRNHLLNFKGNQIYFYSGTSQKTVINMYKSLCNSKIDLAKYFEL